MMGRDRFQSFEFSIIDLYIVILTKEYQPKSTRVSPVDKTCADPIP